MIFPFSLTTCVPPRIYSPAIFKKNGSSSGYVSTPSTLTKVPSALHSNSIVTEVAHSVRFSTLPQMYVLPSKSKGTDTSRSSPGLNCNSSPWGRCLTDKYSSIYSAILFTLFSDIFSATFFIISLAFHLSRRRTRKGQIQN